MDETKKKKPEDLDEKDKKENPEPKSDEQEKEEQKPEDKPKGDESEKPAPDDKQADENGEDADKAGDKPEQGKQPEKEEPKEEEPPEKDDKDEEILRLKTQIAAMELGVSADCMEDAVAIAESYVKNGKAEDINSALQAVVKKYPDMKADGKDGKPNGGFKIGADKPKQKNADEERLNDAFGIKKKK